MTRRQFVFLFTTAIQENLFFVHLSEHFHFSFLSVRLPRIESSLRSALAVYCIPTCRLAEALLPKIPTHIHLRKHPHAHIHRQLHLHSIPSRRMSTTLPDLAKTHSAIGTTTVPSPSPNPRLLHPLSSPSTSASSSSSSSENRRHPAVADPETATAITSVAMRTAAGQDERGRISIGPSVATSPSPSSPSPSLSTSTATSTATTRMPGKEVKKRSLDYVLRSGLAGGLAGCAVRDIPNLPDKFRMWQHVIVLV